MKQTRSYLRIVNMLLIIAAYCYLAYRLLIFDDYASFLEAFRISDGWKWLTILAVLLLMPLNVFCEAGKWRVLLRDIEPMSMWGAQRQVYYGFVGAFVTPYHAGDYPARAMLLKDKCNWSAAVGLGLVGSVALFVVELVLGIPATWLFASYDQQMPMQSFAVAFIVVVVLVSLLPHVVRLISRREWKSLHMQQLVFAFSKMSYSRFMRTIGWSFLRYMIWIVQLALTLHFCGVEMSIREYLIAIPFYYMVIAIFPSLPILNMAIRGTWSLLIFETFSDNDAGVALAVVLIWFINTVLPMLIGSVLYRNGRTK